jgi:hypothetical protein
MECSICLKPYIIFDYVKMFDCGHYLHDLCFMRSPDMSKCPICRRVINSKVSFCLSESSFDIFSCDDIQFRQQLMFIHKYRNLMEVKKQINEHEIEREQILKQTEVIDRFFTVHLPMMKYNVIKKVINLDEKLRTVLYSAHFGDKFMDIPIVFILKGPKDDELYFTKHGITPIIERVKTYFGITDVEIESDYKNQLNSIIAYI